MVQYTVHLLIVIIHAVYGPFCLAERVASFKKLRGGLVFVDAIPRNQAGKVLRRKLAEVYIKTSQL